MAPELRAFVEGVVRPFVVCSRHVSSLGGAAAGTGKDILGKTSEVQCSKVTAEGLNLRAKSEPPSRAAYRQVHALLGVSSTVRQKTRESAAYIHSVDVKGKEFGTSRVVAPHTVRQLIAFHVPTSPTRTYRPSNSGGER
jgi:hypothetical protein